MELQVGLSLNTLSHLDYESQLSVSRQGGFRAVGLHMARLEEYLYSAHTLDQAIECLTRNGLRAIEMQFLPDWLSARGRLREQMLRRAEYICSTMNLMGCPILIANALGEREYSQEVAQENFREICEIGSRYGVSIALEYLPWTSLNTMKQAWDVVRSVKRPNGGIVLDTFHYFKGHPVKAELYAVPIDRVFMVHLDDVEDVDADLVTLTRKHRVAPGEGIFVFDEVLEYLFSQGYAGPFSLEVLNRTHPHQDPIRLAIKLRCAGEALLIDYERKWKATE